MNRNEITDFDKDCVADALANAMEFYTEEEFAMELSIETGYSAGFLSKLFQEYWKLNPTDTLGLDFCFHEFIDTVYENYEEV